MKFRTFCLCLILSSINNVSAIPVEEDLTVTAKEKHALDQFKPTVLHLLPHDYMKTDIYLIKWLRAFNLNLKTTWEMIVNNLKWREKNGMDSILKEDFYEFEVEFPAITDRIDYEGRPVTLLDSSNWDVRKAMVTGKRDALMRYVYRLLEQGVHRIYDAQNRGENVTQGITVLNMKGFNLIQHACAPCIPFYINFVLAFEHHYPGMAHKIVLINTPATFEIVLTAVKPVMSKETKEALTVFGNNKQQWMKFILGMISPDQLSHDFGGNSFD